MTLHVCKHSNLLCSVIFVNFCNFFQQWRHYVVTCQLSAQEIVNWVTTADGCVDTADATVLSRRRGGVLTPPTRRDSTVSSRRRRRCILGLTCVRLNILSDSVTMAYGDSNGHVSDDIKVVTPICLGPNIWKKRLQIRGPVTVDHL